MSIILLAMGDEDLRSEFADIIENSSDLKDLDPNLVLEQREDFSGVHKANQEFDDISIIVMDYDLPMGAHEESDDNVNLPVALATSLHDNGPKVLLLGPLAKIHRQEIELCENSQWIETTEFSDIIPGKETEYGVLRIISMIPRGQRLGDEGGMIDLLIDESNTMKCDTWLIKDGSLVSFSKGEPFQYESSIMRDMDDFTKNLLEGGDEDQIFLRNYRSIGRKAREILSNHKPTSKAIDTLMVTVGGVKNVWIRFQMSNTNITETPFEAILQCNGINDDIDDFQLEYSPVYRVINGSGGTGTYKRIPILSKQFHHKQKISCLVINSSASGPVKKFKGIKFPALKLMPSGDQETEMVVKVFTEMQDKGLISIIDKVEFKTKIQKKDSVAILKNKLNERDWDIVHYCGHSYFNIEENKNSGFLFLPGETFAKPVSIEHLSAWCAKTDLIYMSSCQSAAPGFIHSLAENIPMIIGYRWKVSDIGAAFFAERFYKELFKGDRVGNIETAFSMAQRRLKNPEIDDLPGDFEDNRVWASSMLVLQNV